MRKHLLILLISVFTSMAAFAQVTTSSFSGTIKDSKGETLPGATIKAIHTPSGSTYSSVTNINGRFTLPNVRIGGPYTVTISYIGFDPQTFTGISLKLGEPYLLNVTLLQGGTALKEVVVTGKKEINVARAGASTNISSRMLQTLPTINRSVTDFTRLSPLANGNSFAGRDSRLNNIQVDGASLNNSFGLSTDPFPGGGAQPISIESYDEISVNAAPVDVRQSGFTGAGIYAVTKSGTNTFSGSAYGYYKNQSYNGTNIGDVDISSSFAKSSTKTYGFTLGGPIIKNRVFFFVNYENTKSTTPGLAFSPSDGSKIGTIGIATNAQLQSVSDYLQSKFGYSTGAYDNFPAFAPANSNFLAKLDININDKNKLTLKYSNLTGTTDNQLNGTSIPNIGSGFTPTGRTSAITALPFNRFSTRSNSFQNSNYGFVNNVKTYTAELNSSITSKLSNQILFAVTKTDTKRSFPGGNSFPTIDIFNGTSGDNFITAGNDPFTLNNDVINNTTSITDNLTFYAGKHTITGGVNYDYQYLGNQFMQGAAGYYAYNSLNDFLTDAAPAFYSYTYSLTPGVSAPYSASLKVGTLGIYLQDEVAVSDNFKLTYGIRADKPIYLEDPPENPQVSALQLLDKNGNTKTYNTGQWPSNHFLVSPRAGFRWNVKSDNSLIIRGGAGVFTGKTPYVYLTNMPTNSGMVQFGGAITNSATLAGIKLSQDPTKYANLFPTVAGTSVSSGTVVIDPNYKFPQIFRANLALEKAFGDGYTLTLEGLYTKDINATRYINANYRTPTGLTQEGDLSRERFVGVGTAAAAATDRLIYPGLGPVYLLTNSDQGYTGAFTAQISKSYANGFYGSLGYTYTVAKDINANLGSTAASTYSGNPNVGTSNEAELGNSSFFTPHRVVGNASYTIRYLNHGATTIGLFYQGSLGAPISYVTNGDLNGDGNSNTDLMYIPRNVNDLTFVQTTAVVNGVTYTYTPAQQAAALDQFINNSPYLKKHRGQIAERNAAFLPWYNRVDLNFLQDVYVTVGKTRHTLQFSAVVQNFLNMVDRYWGIQQTTTAVNPVRFNGYVGNTPTYTYTNINGKLITTPFMDQTSNTTWSLLLGLKYKF